MELAVETRQSLQELREADAAVIATYVDVLNRRAAAAKKRR